MLICKSISFKGFSSTPLVLFAFLSLPPPLLPVISSFLVILPFSYKTTVFFKDASTGKDESRGTIAF